MLKCKYLIELLKLKIDKNVASKTEDVSHCSIINVCKFGASQWYFSISIQNRIHSWR